uniref:Ribonuclease H-like domain-containing protein n=1 Tax=Tanacetum cinerariifolium TaxID=118510 RepID=A0A6L2LCA9_TANCI|nr:ribonuclease H-like domain-containing protein [Tanacetum cinerariifolium]
MRMEQYLTFTDHALWEVIVNGDSVSSVTSASTEDLIPPKTVEQKLERKNKLKAKSTLMLAITDEHLLKFHACKDTKSLWEAIKNRFGGNKESKKMQKTILKQNYKNFTASSQEGLDIMIAWNNIALIMRNKSDLYNLSIDDLYNNLKVYESENKSQSSSSSYSHNVAFVSSDNSSSTNEAVNTTHSVSAASYLEQIDIDDLKEMDLKWQVAMLTMRVKRLNATTTIGDVILLENAGHQGIKRIEIEILQQGMHQWTHVLQMPCHISVIYKTGLGYDGHVNESDVLNNVVDSCESDGDDKQVNDRFKKVNASKTSKDSLKKHKTVRSSAPVIEDWESDNKDANVFEPKEVKKTVKPSLEKIEFVNARNTTIENENKAEKPNNFSESPKGSKRNWNGLMTQKLGDGFEFKKKLVFTFTSKKAFQSKSAAKTKNFNEKVSTAKVNNVTTAGTKAVVCAAEGIRNNVVKSSPCWIWRPKRNLIDHISKDSGSYTLKRFNYVDPHGRLKSDQGIFNSGCSRHMTGNKSYITDYQEINGGFVAFGGNAKGGKITGKGKIRTEKLDFEDVYFVKELKFNLFSVSQTCDKKNSVLFTDTECVVLSLDFKLLDESQVLLKVPRNNKMYSFDLKNVVP